MKSFEINHTNRGFQIEGIPDGYMVVELESKTAQRLADLALHRNDLEFALQSLESLNPITDNLHLREALWRSSIMHYFKCFGGNASRFSLQADQILKTEGPLASEIHDYFKSLRNKNLIHDENSYTQSLPCAVLNNGTKSYKVEEIVCTTADISTLGQSNYENLHNLISKALAWVITEFDVREKMEKTELEKMSYEQLSKMNPAVWKKPTVEDVYVKRK
jgi:hypothetical protein